jgi:hypothetical protein
MVINGFNLFLEGVEIIFGDKKQAQELAILGLAAEISMFFVAII